MHLIKYLFVIALLAGTQNIYGQNNLYLKPYIGTGVSDWGGNPIDRKWAGTGKRGRGLSAGVDVSLSSHRWHKSIGINFLRIGIAGTNIYFDLNNTLVKAEKFSAVHQHILVPVKFGYEIHIGKLSLIPELGLAPAYHAASTIAITDAETHEVRRDKLTFSGSGVRKFSLFAIAGINLAYHINDHISVTIAPAYYLMLSNNLTRGGSFLNYVGSSHQYALTGNVGVLLKL